MNSKVAEGDVKQVAQMDFRLMRDAVARQFKAMSAHELFRTGIGKDDLWSVYLSSFPAGSNLIYKTRTEHDCQCCKQFIRAVGNAVVVIDGEIVSIWDCTVGDPRYQAVADAMSAAVKAHPIIDAFLHYEVKAGTERSLQDTFNGVKTWNHFFVNLPSKFVLPKAEIAAKLSVMRSAHDVMARGLSELTADALDAVSELITQNSLYRGAEHKFAVDSFAALKATYDGVAPEMRDAFVWRESKKATTSVSGFRNTSIGTLVTALSEGKELDDAVRAFESMVAPANYKRPTALVTKAMIEKAKAEITKLGLSSALERRYATVEDITVNNVLFADRSTKRAMKGDVFDTLSGTVPAKVKSLDKVEEVPIDKFIRDILPRTTSLEVMVENRHVPNLVSLIAPADSTALPLFKWGNNFSWSYNGDMADSIAERVKKAGGSITGDLCCRLAWNYTDDLDLHMREPGRGHIFYDCRRIKSACGGVLDVDANGVDGPRSDPVENIFYASKGEMQDGMYALFVNNYRRRSDGAGFEVEIEVDGTVHHLTHEKAMRTGETIAVAEISYSKKTGFIVKPHLSSVQASRQAWSLSTQNFYKVTTLMMSPNFWDGQLGVGNKHFFFMLEGCRNEGKARGFFNEFLKAELDPHRKVIEMVGAKMKTEEADHQLSGLGFSSTQRNSVLCKVAGAFTRTVKVVF